MAIGLANLGGSISARILGVFDPNSWLVNALSPGRPPSFVLPPDTADEAYTVFGVGVLDGSHFPYYYTVVPDAPV